jgi:hypothetical protein
VHDAADHATIIDPVRSFAPSRQQRLNSLPFRIAQPVNLLCHPSLSKSLGELESQIAGLLNPIEYTP